jgi:hypothetical protein
MLGPGVPVPALLQARQGRGHPVGQVAVQQQACQAIRDRGQVAPVHHVAGPAVLDSVLDAAEVAGEHRQPGRRGL